MALMDSQPDAQQPDGRDRLDEGPRLSAQERRRRLDAVRFANAWAPAFNNVVKGGYPASEPDGVSLTTATSDPVHAYRLRVDDDGTIFYFCGGVASSWEGEGYVLRETAVTQIIFCLLHFAGQLYRDAGYMGRVDLGVALRGIAGAKSGWAATGNSIPPPLGWTLLKLREYTRLTSAAASALATGPAELTMQLIGPLLRVVGGPPHDPLALQP